MVKYGDFFHENGEWILHTGWKTNKQKNPQPFDK